MIRRSSWLLAAALLAGCLPSATPPRGDGPAFSVKTEGSGPPVILMAGLASSGDVWNGTVEHLRAQHRVYVLQLAGQAGNPARSGPFLTGERDALIAWVQSEHLQKPVLVGHSVGGVIAIAAAEARPDLFARVVSVDGVPFSPAMVDPGATADSLKRRAHLTQLAISRLSRGEAFQNFWHAQAKGMVTAPRDLARVDGWAAQSDPAEVALAVAETLTTDLRPELARARVPLLLIGSRTLAGSVPSEALEKRYAAQLAGAPEARVVVDGHARHFVMLDDPTFFLATLDAFLGGGAQ